MMAWKQVETLECAELPAAHPQAGKGLVGEGGIALTSSPLKGREKTGAVWRRPKTLAFVSPASNLIPKYCQEQRRGQR